MFIECEFSKHVSKIPVVVDMFLNSAVSLFCRSPDRPLHHSSPFAKYRKSRHVISKDCKVQSYNPGRSGTCCPICASVWWRCPSMCLTYLPAVKVYYGVSDSMQLIPHPFLKRLHSLFMCSHPYFLAVWNYIIIIKNFWFFMHHWV